MLAKFCKTDKTYYLERTEALEKKLLVEFAPYAKATYPVGTKYHKRAVHILDTLVEEFHNIGIDFGYLENTGSSCYLDSSLFGLFIYPTDFIDRNILYSRVVGNDMEKLQKELVNINNSIHNQYIIDCKLIRKALRKFPGVENYHKPGPKDAGEFLIHIFNLFDTNKATTITQTYGTDEDAKNLTLTNVVTDRKSSVIRFIPEDILMKVSQKTTTDISEFLTQIDDAVLDEPYTDKGISFTRRISKSTLVSTPYLIFLVSRMGMRGNVIKTPILPSRKLSLNSGQEFSLSAIVTYVSNHYVCYFKSGLKWYLYDDLSGISEVGQYEDMIYSRPNPVRFGTLYYYVPF